jgi:hypothetical protein
MESDKVSHSKVAIWTKLLDKSKYKSKKGANEYPTANRRQCTKKDSANKSSDDM